MDCRQFLWFRLVLQLLALQLHLLASLMLVLLKLALQLVLRLHQELEPLLVLGQLQNLVRLRTKIMSRAMRKGKKRCGFS
jgi:hypothetical protein